MTISRETAAGVVLAGGRSARMGASKAWLEWHGSTLLRRTAGLLGRAVEGPVVVVRAPGQALPPLPPDVEVVDDPVEGLGPMLGIATGLAAVEGRAAVAFVCSTDLPFLHPAYVRRVLRAIDADADVVLPHARGHRQPLAAGYRTALAPAVARLVDDGVRRLMLLPDHFRVRGYDEGALLADPVLAELDPDLDSVLNVNEPAHYAEARARPAPAVTVLTGRGGRRTVRAATLRGAALAVGIALDRQVVVLNGEETSGDAELPLVAGDVLGFRAAGCA